MSLAQGRTILSIPGPSVMPDRVLSAMHQAAPNIYQGPIVDMMPALVADLRAVGRSSQKVAIYIGNGHAGWEAATSNVFSRGDKALALVTGHFGIGWANHAKAMGIEVETLDFGRRAAVDPAQVEAALRADHGHDIRAVLLTHAETSTTVLNDVAAVRAAIDAAGHPALLMVDCIASLGCDRFEFDAWGVDVMVAASQKGLMVPPGLCFLWISDRAYEAGKAAGLRTPYWDWTARVDPAFFAQYFFGTAPTHHLMGLREALTMIVHEEGIEQVWARHNQLARAVWAAVETWGQGSAIELNILAEAERSRAVTSVRFTSPDATRLRQWCEAEAGVTLGIGLGMAPQGDPATDGFLRIGHMGHLNAHMVLGTLTVMEAGLQALGIPHGAGGSVAAARVVAKG